MGLLRFQLALFVAIGHLGALTGWETTWGDFEPLSGTAAVQVFFVLSGFYMNAAYSRLYANAPLFASRILRLWPSYLASLAIAGILFWILALSRRTAFERCSG